MDPVFEVLLALLPPHLATYLWTACAIAGAVSVAVLPLKAALERWASPEWRVRLDVIFIVLDWIAVNSKPMRDRPWREEKRK